jgi:hypothetical protein
MNLGSQLQDASILNGTPPAQPEGVKEKRRTINFTRLLLNAPIVQSRYLGTISGVIVAEYVLPSLGSFQFQYDPVFNNVDAFPALKDGGGNRYDILCVGEADTACNRISGH